MVKWANDGFLQAIDGKMLVNDGKYSLIMVKCSLIIVNDGEMLSMWWGEMSIWSYNYFTIID